jgi:transposase
MAASIKHREGLIPAPKSVDIAAFGDVVALYDLAQQIGLVELLDRHLPKRDQGLSVGQYLLLAAINRVVHPTSKRQFADWFRETTLPRHVPVMPAQLSSQAFWNHFDFVEEGHIEAIERELSQRLVEKFDISLRTLTYDGTNFFTFIDTQSPGDLPQRGHNKQKRNDLRQVSLGMLVSTDFHVPLFHKVYAGNIPDSRVFKTVSEELRKRYAELARECEHITLVFDKGNNSKEAFETLAGSDFNFVGSLVPSHHADLECVRKPSRSPRAAEANDCAGELDEGEVVAGMNLVTNLQSAE